MDRLEFEVSISVPGTFHAFELAKQLDRRDGLGHLYTSDLSFRSTAELPRSNVTHIRYPELLLQVGRRLPVSDTPVVLKNWLFDRAVRRRLSLREGDVFVGFSGCSLASITRANDLGVTTVVERASAHTIEQMRLLEEEYERCGIDRSPVPNRQIDQQLEEDERADYVAVPSSFVAESFRAHGVPESKLITVPYGVDTDRFSGDGYSEQPDDTFRCLFVGHVNARKGVRYLLKAWDRLDLSNAELLLAGGMDAEFESLVQSYEDRTDVKFLGWVDDIEKYYGSASAFVFPSLEDGFAYVVLEAMSAELPVVVTEHTGAKDCVEEGKTGYVVPPRDVEALADRIKWLYDHPDDRRSMGERARQRVLSDYTWDDYGRRIVAEYERITDSASGAD